MTCSRVEGPVARGLRDFCGLPRNSLTSRTSSREKHLDKFFKIFVLSVLATDPGDLLVTWLSRENRVFLHKMHHFLNLFSFPSNISNCSSSSLPETLSNSLCHSRMNFHICFFSFPNLQEKGLGFVSYTSSFTFTACLLDCVCSIDICISLDCLWVSVFLVKSWCDFWCLYTDLLYIELIFSH